MTNLPGPGYLGNDEIHLVLANLTKADPEKGYLPAYCFQIRRCLDDALVGSCVLRVGQNAAVQYSMDNIFDYINLGDDYSIVEIRIPSDWVGTSLRALDVRSRYRVNILATKRGEMIYPAIAPDAVLEADETLILMGRLKDIRDLTED